MPTLGTSRRRDMTIANIRLARASDLERLTEIYNYYVINTPITFDLEPFSVAERCEWFRHYSAFGPHRLLLAETDGLVVGYVTSSRFRPKAAYETSVETSIYFAPEATGRGMGTALYAALFAALAEEDLHRAYAGVTLPNPASLALHRKFGFRSIGVYREVGRKFGKYWDVEWFEKPLDSIRPNRRAEAEPTVASDHRPLADTDRPARLRRGGGRWPRRG
jgi:phosphinothricin acetyltransferase